MKTTLEIGDVIFLPTQEVRISFPEALPAQSVFGGEVIIETLEDTVVRESRECSSYTIT